MLNFVLNNLYFILYIIKYSWYHNQRREGTQRC
ncbi:hypothetical protein SAMN06265337_3118 [Hymenobacter gelipurpurascens]|uniref:Uncharacterized protein n=1 Tax=Hymenobacter gelipurpurascens TaxID=89968 RepID=A0A212UCF2_9BACT|nr:hypothetical protein SAMN06265337_3118 [Hymenobacter gelipurpurascens]